jgi:hypothetical protein
MLNILPLIFRGDQVRGLALSNFDRLDCFDLEIGLANSLVSAS